MNSPRLGVQRRMGREPYSVCVCDCRVLWVVYSNGLCTTFTLCECTYLWVCVHASMLCKCTYLFLSVKSR